MFFPLNLIEQKRNSDVQWISMGESASVSFFGWLSCSRRPLPKKKEHQQRHLFVGWLSFNGELAKTKTRRRDPFPKKKEQKGHPCFGWLSLKETQLPKKRKNILFGWLSFKETQLPKKRRRPESTRVPHVSSRPSSLRLLVGYEVVGA